jgi:hypothetical protein
MAFNPSISCFAILAAALDSDVNSMQKSGPRYSIGGLPINNTGENDKVRTMESKKNA